MNVEMVPGSHPHAFRLQDTVNVSVILQQSQMFVNDWVFRQPQQFQDDMLHHEQGHYDLVALFCRDMFIDMVAIRSQTFPNPNAVLTAVTQVMTRYDRFIAGVHDLYDNDAQHGRVAAQQQRWDGFIQAAFNNPRMPPLTLPDGTAAKAQLFDVLRAGGVVL